MTQRELIITLLADDRPGVIQSVSDTVAEVGGNWLDSRMSQLAGQFAGILKISIGEDNVESLIQKLKALGDSGIQVLVQEACEMQPTSTNKTIRFELVGPDRIGIVSEIAHAFTESGISIDDLETRCSSTPWSGEPLFEAEGTLIASEHINTDDLLGKLDAIENKIGVHISLTEQL